MNLADLFPEVTFFTVQNTNADQLGMTDEIHAGDVRTRKLDESKRGHRGWGLASCSLCMYTAE